MRNNKSLNKAKLAKNDEFYTRYEDIEKELKYYIQHFNNKTIYCNCDDYNKSNFFKYFYDNFQDLKLKKLITTSYNKEGKGNYSEFDGETLKTGNLTSNGSFDSEESLNYLKEADIVITNPPFSLFREYVDVLFAFNKKFIIIGNNNAITYKEFFPHIKNGEVWLGRTLFTGTMPYFIVSNNFETTNERIIEENDKRLKQVNGVCWFTNLDNNKEEIISLFSKYNPTDYPKYDNYDAINVNFIKDMPYDYDGVIGVPITALKYLCSDGLLHFDTPMIENDKTIYKIVDCNDCRKENMNEKNTMLVKDKDSAINGKPIYARVLIKKKRVLIQSIK